MSQAPPTRRRWFQFGLRALLLFAGVTGVLLAWLALQLDHLRIRKTTVSDIEARGGRVHRTIEPTAADPYAMEVVNTLPVWRRMLGDESFDILDMPPSATKDEVMRTRKLFPEARSVEIKPDGPRILFPRQPKVAR